MVSLFYFRRAASDKYSRGSHRGLPPRQRHLFCRQQLLRCGPTAAVCTLGVGAMPGTLCSLDGRTAA